MQSIYTTLTGSVSCYIHCCQCVCEGHQQISMEQRCGRKQIAETYSQFLHQLNMCIEQNTLRLKWHGSIVVHVYVQWTAFFLRWSRLTKFDSRSNFARSGACEKHGIIIFEFNHLLLFCNHGGEGICILRHARILAHSLIFAYILASDFKHLVKKKTFLFCT